MDIEVWIVLGGTSLVVLLALILVYKRRHLLVHHTRFTAETVMQNWQTEARRAAMTEVSHTREKKRQDQAGLDFTSDDR